MSPTTMRPATLAPARGRDALQATPGPETASLTAGPAHAGGRAPRTGRARPTGDRTTGEDA